MENVAVSLIGRLPDWYLMVGVPLLIAFVFLYVLPHIRRDKQGKLYWHNDRTETIKQTRKMDTLLDHIDKYEARFAALENNQSANELRHLRYEILLNMRTTPEKVDLINKLIDEYIAKGGNGYIRGLIEEWQRIYQGLHKK